MSGWQPSDVIVQEAIRMTAIMRSSPTAPWSEMRERLESAGVALGDCVLADWVTEGGANMGATIATRNGRVFDVMAVMGYRRDNQRVSREEGYVSSFREVPAESITTVASGPASGLPNSWLQAALVARMILDSDAGV